MYLLPEVCDSLRSLLELRVVRRLFSRLLGDVLLQPSPPCAELVDDSPLAPGRVHTACPKIKSFTVKQQFVRNVTREASLH